MAASPAQKAGAARKATPSTPQGAGAQASAAQTAANGGRAESSLFNPATGQWIPNDVAARDYPYGINPDGTPKTAAQVAAEQAAWTKANDERQKQIVDSSGPSSWLDRGTNAVAAPIDAAAQKVGDAASAGLDSLVAPVNAAFGTNPNAGVSPAGGGPVKATTSALSDPDSIAALRDAMAKANTQYGDLKNQAAAAPGAAQATFNPVTSTDVVAQKAHASSYDPTHATSTGYTAGQAGTTLVPGATTIGGPGPISTALQQGVTASGTTLDQAESEQSRAAQAQNLEDLRATAQGQGAGQIAAKARLQQALISSGQQANGLVQQARGDQRAGARLSALLAASNAGLSADVAERAQEGTEQQTAQQAISQNLQQQRTTDVDVASKAADLAQQRNLAQAQLDQAKASGDQNAINAATMKLADLDQQTRVFNATQTQDIAKTNAAATNQGAQFNVTEADRAAAANAASATDVSKANAGFDTTALKDAADNATQTSQFNAGQGNTVATGNAERGQNAQVQTNAQGLAAESAGASQRAQLEQLMQGASAQQQAAANSILAEGDRNKQLALAQQQLAQAKSQSDRSFWTGIVSSLVTGGATILGGVLGGPAGAVAAGTVANALVSNQQNQSANNAISNTDQNNGGTADVEPGLYGHGGLVTKPTRAIIGEAGPELVIPVKGVTAKLAAALAQRNKPFARKDAVDLRTLLAAATVKSRKERARA